MSSKRSTIETTFQTPIDDHVAVGQRHRVLLEPLSAKTSARIGSVSSQGATSAESANRRALSVSPQMPRCLVDTWRLLAQPSSSESKPSPPASAGRYTTVPRYRDGDVDRHGPHPSRDRPRCIALVRFRTGISRSGSTRSRTAERCPTSGSAAPVVDAAMVGLEAVVDAPQHGLGAAVGTDLAVGGADVRLDRVDRQVGQPRRPRRCSCPA